MKNEFNKGVLLTSLGSFWWGFIGVIYFEYVSFIGHIELVVHRCLWTGVMLFITTSFLFKWKSFFRACSDKKTMIALFFSGLLIFTNWAVWIYAVATERIIDASFGYFIMPIISVLLGYIFFKEKLNNKRIFFNYVGSSFNSNLNFFNFKTIPWVGLIVAFSWAFYNLIRKKIDIETDIGLLIESLYILPFALITFYFITKNGFNDFSLNNLSLSFILILAGPMTVIPLFLYVRGVELIGLGATGMVFYLTPTLQFILGYFYYDEGFSLIKFVSFIIIWIAVIIYIKDLYETN